MSKNEGPYQQNQAPFCGSTTCFSLPKWNHNIINSPQEFANPLQAEIKQDRRLVGSNQTNTPHPSTQKLITVVVLPGNRKASIMRRPKTELTLFKITTWYKTSTVTITPYLHELISCAICRFPTSTILAELTILESKLQAGPDLDEALNSTISSARN